MFLFFEIPLKSWMVVFEGSGYHQGGHVFASTKRLGVTATENDVNKCIHLGPSFSFSVVAPVLSLVPKENYLLVSIGMRGGGSIFFARPLSL